MHTRSQYWLQGLERSPQATSTPEDEEPPEELDVAVEVPVVVPVGLGEQASASNAQPSAASLLKRRMVIEGRPGSSNGSRYYQDPSIRGGAPGVVVSGAKLPAESLCLPGL